MELSIQEVHFYNNLVNQGEAEELTFHGVDDGNVIIPRLDDQDRVYFLDLGSRVKIYPGENLIEKIKKTVDKHLKQG